MPQQIVVIHKHVVKHKHKRYRKGVVRSAWGVAGAVPGAHGLLIFLAMAVGYSFAIALTPNYDIPYMPFASSQCGPQEVPEGGVVGASYTVGDGIHGMLSEPPSVAEVYDGLLAFATGAGEVVGTLAAAIKGEGQRPTVTVTPPTGQGGVTEAGYGNGCTPCPTGTGDTSGTILAADTAPSETVLTTARAALSTGWSADEAIIATAIAGAESGYDPNAVGQNSDSHQSRDHGLWQINDYWHADLLASGDPYDPEDNARMAHTIQAAAGDWNDWYVYRDGKYETHLAEAKAAVEQVSGGIVPIGETCTVPTGYTGGDDAIAWATGHVGIPYLWGGCYPGVPSCYAAGPDAGPTAQIPADCSGFTSAAFWYGEGVDIGRTARDQIADDDVVLIPPGQEQPGDLAFGSFLSDGPHHVALVVAPGQVAEEPRSGLSSRVRAYDSDDFQQFGRVSVSIIAAAQTA